MPNEALVSRIETLLDEVVALGGASERTGIVSGLIVVDSAPSGTALANHIIVRDNRDGNFISVLKTPGQTYVNNDLVSVLFIEGTEPIALAQSPGSSSSNVKVSEVWESDFGAVTGSADASGNWTWQNNVTLNGGDLIFSGVGQINATGGIGFDGNGAGTFNALIIDASDDVIVNNSQGGANFLVRGDGGMSLFFVDATNELVTVNENGEDVDFRIEGDTDPNLFFVDAGNDRIGFGTNVPNAFVALSHLYSSSTSVTGMTITDTWSPSTTSGNVFPTSVFLFSKYDTTHTPAGGFLTAFRLFAEIEDSGVLNIRNMDIFSANDGAGTVADVKDIVIRALGNSGGGAITAYTAIFISNSTAAGSNKGLVQDGTSMINQLAGDTFFGALGTPLAKVHIDQASTTGAKPVLYLDQADLSEEFIEFAATVGAGNPIDTAAIGTYYGKIRVGVAGVGFKYMPLHNS